MVDGYGVPWHERAAARWGHFAPELLMVAIAGIILIGLRPPSGALMFTAPLALLGLVIVSWVLMRRHDRGLCEQCVAGLPLNPSQQATKYELRFWLAHSLSQPRYLLPYVAVLVGSNFLPGTTGRLIWALAQASMVYLIMAHTTHRRLQPWCPWCRDDGGGGWDDHDPATPDPVPGNRRQLV